MENYTILYRRVNRQGIHYKLCSCGYLRFYVVYIATISINRSQHVMVDGCQSKLVYDVSGVPQAVN